MSRKTYCVALLALALVAIQSASAHNLITYTVTPDGWSRAAEVPDPDVSRVIYRESTPASPQTWLRFRGTKGKKIWLSLGVPKIDRLARFRPAVALVGPGLPAADLPLDLPPGAGAQVFPNTYPADASPPVFHESFTGTDSWTLVETELVLPADGQYYLVAFQPGAELVSGKLWLAIGTKEKFTLAEIFGLGKVKKFVRQFHEVR
jgi:hypothetical protein